MRWTSLVLAAFVFAGCVLGDDGAYQRTSAPHETPGAHWELVADPSTRGWSPAGLEAARRQASALGSSAVMVLDDGRLVAAWGDTTGRWYVASVRKSLLSLLYGELVRSGRVSLDATLESVGLDEDTPLTPAERRATVRQLLTSTSGIYLPAAASDTPLPPRGSHQPGETFTYNNWGFNAAGTLFDERDPSVDLYEAFDARLATPLGLEDFVRARDGRYERIAASRHAAYHFDLTARDLARLGLLVSRQGRWGETEVVEASWLSESTAPHVSTGPREGSMGYGFMWWVCTEGSDLAAAGMPVGTVFANGNLNQFVAVIPGRKLVVVHRGPTGDVSWAQKAALVRSLVEAAPR
ncbi:MAG: serine hydrolase [Myxococcaceae bacterium]|nr:serine hydrolase [Myxococcaceae bacterium]